MGRKGDCFDNALIESFLGTLKAEYFHLVKSDGLVQLKAVVHGLHLPLQLRAHQAQSAKAQPGGIPAEKYDLKFEITTVQLLEVSSNTGQFSVQPT